MAETLISPGLLLRENDLSQISEAPLAAGAALIGPTVFGPVDIPTLVRSYSDYKSKFGGSFVSGGQNYEYLTSIAALNYFEQGGNTLLVTRVASGSYTSATASVPSQAAGNPAAFVLETLSVGTIMNNSGSNAASYNTASGFLLSGSTANVRFEIAAASSASGQFTLLIRRGDDNAQNKTILETWTNLSLDPNQSNYISYVIGDQIETRLTDEFGNAYLQVSGSYGNKSRYVRVKSVLKPTPNYYGSTGVPNPAYTASIPAVSITASGSGAFAGAAGAIWGYYGQAPLNMFESIPTTVASTSGSNIQGVLQGDYTNALNLLANKESYNFNTIYAPGINAQNSPTTVQALLDLATNRGDAIAVVDMTGYGQTMTIATTNAAGFDNSYAATYFPWLQVRSRETGKMNFVPASTLIPAMYQYNDKVAAEWFAPAGLNRGTLASVLRPERKLSLTERNFLYQGKVNPIAQFSGVGTVVYGQKTLQAAATALDRVNVRRLIISLKKYIKSVAENLVFEPNTQITRNKFLNQVNPYLEYVQQRQGVYAFQVIMDDSNNTADVVDRNQLVGAVYIQPTRVAEFIYIDFNIMPTGASFGA
jgi:phage tail sheath protein FI